MLQSVSKLGKEWWWDKWPETEPSFSHCPGPDSSYVWSARKITAQAYIISSPGQSWWATDLCKGMQPFAEQTSLDACSITPGNRGALFLSPGILPDNGKIKASPYSSKSPALLCTWPRKGSSRHLQRVSQRKVSFSEKIHTKKFRQNGKTCSSEEGQNSVWCWLWNIQRSQSSLPCLCFFVTKASLVGFCL